MLVALAALAVALAALTAHAAAMNDAMGDHVMGDAAAICLVVGGALAAVSVAVFAVGRRPQRPLWVIPQPLAPALPFLPASSGFLARAGPPPVLQVFRL